MDSPLDLSDAGNEPENQREQPGQLMASKVGEALTVPDGKMGLAEPYEAADNANLICGVDRELIEKFLVVIRDYYKKADKATFFLEQRTERVNVSGIANIRDVLSHLVTMLDPKTPEKERAIQLENAVEHLRRAIVEPYETAVNELTVKFRTLYDNYKKHVIPVKDKHVPLGSAPTTANIDATLREIGDLISEGRAAKAKNFWDFEWETGVTSFINAYDKLFDLNRTLEEYHYKYEQLTTEKTDFKVSTALHIIGHIIGIAGILIALIFILKPTWADALRQLFHVAP